MEIPEIKQRLSMATVLQHYNLTPDRNKQICCPFHDDDTPSCRIYPATNTFHCFGCGATGDVIEFIMLLDKCSKHKAITRAAALITNYALNQVQGQITRNGAAVKEKATPHLIPHTANLTPHTEVLSRAFTHFARSLHAKPKKAVEYLESRKLDYTSLTIGYDAGTLHKVKDTTEQQKQEYLQAGLLKPD